jgi:hypothetical protein
MPMHKAKGKTNYNSLWNNYRKMGPLMRHLEYLMEFGDEVRATRVVTTLVEGMEARVNRDNDDGERYLPMSMGYRNCYNRYLASLDILTCGIKHLGRLFWGNERTEKP